LFVTVPVLALPHLCREKTLSCRKKKTRHRFALGSSQADLIELMLERWLARTMGLKCLTRRRISGSPVSGRARNSAQVLELASASRPSGLLVQRMRLNRFNRRGFSSCPPRGEAAKRRSWPQSRRNCRIAAPRLRARS
jgi:hypothetical protein